MRVQEPRTSGRIVRAMPTWSVRWDRVGRMALLFVGLLLICLYVNPVRTYVATRQEAKTKRAEVAALQAERRALLKRAQQLRQAGSIEIEARKLGMVRRTERAYVVRGLPQGE